MRADPLADALLADVRRAGKPRTETMSPHEARRTSREAKLLLAGEPLPIGQVEDLRIDRPGMPIPARIYRRRLLGEEDGARPLLVFFHGGGWMIGDLDTHDQLCRRLANETDGTVLAVDYRLAPENKFPAAVEDALYAVAWAAENAEVLGVDAARLSVGGDSAGGNLAVVAALANRGADAVRIRSQVLLYPVLDMSLQLAADYELDKDFPLTHATLEWFRSHYLRSADDEQDWRASPLLEDRLEGVPPALVVTARYDPLYPEAMAYLRRLQDCGVRTVHLHMNDQCHGFLNTGHHDPVKAEILRMVCAGIRYLWNAHAPSP